MLLSKADIIGAQDIAKELVPVPEWGGDIYVIALSERERDRLLKSLTKEGKVSVDDIRSRWCAYCIVDESGQRLFIEEADIEALAAKSAIAIDRVFAAVERMNALSSKAVDELKKA